MTEDKPQRAQAREELCSIVKCPYCDYVENLGEAVWGEEEERMPAMEGVNDGPMPWRLQIAAVIYGSNTRRQNIHEALAEADQLVAAHLATVPKCEHRRTDDGYEEAWPPYGGGGRVYVGKKCLDCGAEVKP
jgi:hypothetical protein